jgi:hypothetical protein
MQLEHAGIIMMHADRLKVEQYFVGGKRTKHARVKIDVA